MWSFNSIAIRDLRITTVSLINIILSSQSFQLLSPQFSHFLPAFINSIRISTYSHHLLIELLLIVILLILAPLQTYFLLEEVQSLFFQ
jgi:hypothetical protein